MRKSVWVVGAIGLVALFLAAFYVGGGWILSSMLETTAFDVASVRSASIQSNYPVKVVALSNDQAVITLTVPDPAGQLLTAGTWGLEASDGGYGQVGTIERSGGGTISRRFRQMAGPPISAGKHVKVDNKAFPQDPLIGLGIAFENVDYAGPLGSYPAWYIPGQKPDWAVLVHGKSLLRQDMLRLVGPLHRLGLPELVITYRNDVGSPTDPSGRLGYGTTEWRDVEAAASYSIAHGARHIVLVAVSMGGGVAASFLYHSTMASFVTKVILDSPMLDFSQSVDLAAASKSLPVIGLPLPRSLVSFAKTMSSWRFGTDWQSLDYLARDSRLKAPILLFHGSADDIVPRSVSDRLAADRPDLVTYVITAHAAHIDSWNLDPDGYERSVTTFLATG